MNECFLLGKIINDIQFYFAIGGKHDSIVKFKLQLENGSVINIKAFDENADYCYRKLKENQKVIVYGNVETDLEINIRNVYVISNNTRRV